jgi:hypothetical protein
MPVTKMRSVFNLQIALPNTALVFRSVFNLQVGKSNRAEA